MKVKEPTGYDVELTVEEIKIMSKCKEVLQGIVDILEEKRCDTLVDSESNIVDLEAITVTINDLDTMIDAKKMYQGEFSPFLAGPPWRVDPIKKDI